MISPLLLDEIKDVLLERPRLRRWIDLPTAQRYLTTIETLADIVKDPAPGEQLTRDPNDDYLIYLARERFATSWWSSWRGVLRRDRPRRMRGRAALSSMTSSPQSRRLVLGLPIFPARGVVPASIPSDRVPEDASSRQQPWAQTPNPRGSPLETCWGFYKPLPPQPLLLYFRTNARRTRWRVFA